MKNDKLSARTLNLRFLMAAVQQDFEFLEKCHTLDAFIICKYDFDRTLLHLMAASDLNLPVTKWLLNKGANIHLQDSIGLTAVQIAQEMSSKKTEKYLTAQDRLKNRSHSDIKNDVQKTKLRLPRKGLDQLLSD